MEYDNYFVVSRAFSTILSEAPPTDLIFDEDFCPNTFYIKLFPRLYKQLAKKSPKKMAPSANFILGFPLIHSNHRFSLFRIGAAIFLIKTNKLNSSLGLFGYTQSPSIPPILYYSGPGGRNKVSLTNRYCAHILIEPFFFQTHDMVGPSVNVAFDFMDADVLEKIDFYMSQHYIDFDCKSSNMIYDKAAANYILVDVEYILHTSEDDDHFQFLELGTGQYYLYCNLMLSWQFFPIIAGIDFTDIASAMKNEMYFVLKILTAASILLPEYPENIPELAAHSIAFARRCGFPEELCNFYDLCATNLSYLYFLFFLFSPRRTLRYFYECRSNQVFLVPFLLSAYMISLAKDAMEKKISKIDFPEEKWSENLEKIKLRLFKQEVRPEEFFEFDYMTEYADNFKFCRIGREDGISLFDGKTWAPYLQKPPQYIQSVDLVCMCQNELLTPGKFSNLCVMAECFNFERTLTYQVCQEFKTIDPSHKKFIKLSPWCLGPIKIIRPDDSRRLKSCLESYYRGKDPDAGWLFL